MRNKSLWREFAIRMLATVLVAIAYHVLRDMVLRHLSRRYPNDDWDLQ